MMWLLVCVNPPRYFNDKTSYHVPILQIEDLEFDEKKALDQAEKSEGVIVTSQETVRRLKSFFQKITQGKKVFCTGPNTLMKMKNVYDGQFFLPPTYDQEGLLELIYTHRERSFFYPKAKVIRTFLIDELKKNGYHVHTLDCYQSKKIQVYLDDANKFDGYYFGSSSCVEAFYQICKTLRSQKILVPGHVTKDAVEFFYGNHLDIQVIPFTDLSS